MKIRAVILDFDGVINDSARKGRERIIKIVREASYPIPPDIRQKLKHGWGEHGTKLIEKCFGLNFQTAARLYQEWERIDATKFFPLVKGAKKALVRLDKMRWEKSLRVCLLTSRNRENLSRVMIHYDLLTYFYSIQAKDDWSFIKPDPHAFCWLLDKLSREDVFADNCVYVGDTPIDFKAATARGVACICVLTGLFNHSDFLEIGQKKRKYYPLYCRPARMD